jgi:ABC-2 type transport system permease protein
MIRTISALMRKEFLQVIRDRNMLRLIFLIPVVQLLVLGYAVSTDVKFIKADIYDFDKTVLSREYAATLSAGDYFLTRYGSKGLLESDRSFKENLSKAVVIIPKGFSEDITERKSTSVGLVMDGTNANTAAIALGYANLITEEFNRKRSGFSPPVRTLEKRLYNPEGESVNFMVPGIVATLVTMITVMLTSMAIVREREIGTLEQLMVTPITIPALLMGKTIPFALLAYIEMSVALAVGILWFDIPFAGSWLLLYAISFVFLFTTLGLGMFVSTISSTQQQAMFFAWFFFIYTILTSGFFTPIANMPRAIQYITYLNPLRYYLKIVRAIIMKGASADILYPEIAALVVFGTTVFSLAWIRFSKRVK